MSSAPLHFAARLRAAFGVALRLSFLVAAAALPARAQDLAGCETSKQWRMEQISENHFKLIGAVEVKCGEQSFSADELEFFTDTDRLIATGNVVFTSGDNRIAADRLEYFTNTKTGVFYNATGTASLQGEGSEPREREQFGTQEPDVYFYGEKLEKIGERKYKISKGGFTTCVQPSPRWQLTSGTVLLNLDHYAILTNSLFKVKGVPVLYMPVFYYPVNKDDRATGILIPTYGSSTIRGQSLSNAFFWAIGRSHDATFLHDWFSKSGQGLGAEYRYVAGAGSEGQLRVYNLRENAAPVAGEDGTDSQERRSYEVRGALTQRLGAGWRVRGRADYFSDISVQQTYHQNVYEASRRQRTYSGAVSGNLGRWSINGIFERSELFYGTTQSTVRGGTPKISVQRSDTPLFGSPIYFSVAAEGARMIAERRTSSRVVDQGLTRFDLQPRLRFPITAWPFLTISTSASFRTTFWSESRDPETGLNVDDPINRNYYDLSAEVTGPTFNRIWNRPGSSYAEKLKHSIEPYFNVQRISAIDNFDSIVRLDGVDGIVGNVTRLGYGINNRFFRKPGGNGRSTEILTVSIGQTYYTDERASQFDRRYQSSYGSAPSRFSPLTIQARAWPLERVNAQFRAEYDTQFNAFRTWSMSGTAAIGDWLHTTAGWSQRRFIEGLDGFDDPARLDHYVNSATTLRLWRNRVGVVYNFNYDVLRSKYLQQRVMTYYNAQCCGFSVEFQEYDLSGLSSLAVPKDRRFNFGITLAGIGTFSNFFGALGGAERGY